MKPDKFIKDKLYIQEDLVEERRLKRYYETVLYNEPMCQKCEYYEDRPCTVCDGCDCLVSKIRLWGRKRIKDKDYVYVPCGNLKRASQALNIDLSDVKDYRKIIPFDHKIKFTGKLYDGTIVDGVPRANQVEVTRNYLKYKYGIIQSPPRTGKCVCGNTLISTDKGLQKIEAIVGDIPENTCVEYYGKEVYNKDKITPIGGLYRSKSNTIKIITEDGYEIEGTPEHKILSEGEFISLDNLKVGDIVDLSLKNTLLYSDYSIDLENVVYNLLNNENYSLPRIFYENGKAVFDLFNMLFKNSNKVDIKNKKVEKDLQVIFSNINKKVKRYE